MTYREKLKMDHPDRVKPEYGGGCFGCPHHYGYEQPYRCDGLEADKPFVCDNCWSREVQP